jgi:hypothetical protein
LGRLGPVGASRKVVGRLAVVYCRRGCD